MSASPVSLAHSVTGHFRFHVSSNSCLAIGILAVGLHPKSLKMAVFGCKKMALQMPKSKNGHHFCRQLYPKMVDGTLVSDEYHFRLNFGQILKIINFWLFFGRFPLIKPQNKNPMVHSVNFSDKNLIFGIWFPYIKRQLNLIGWVTQNDFFFLRNYLFSTTAISFSYLRYIFTLPFIIVFTQQICQTFPTIHLKVWPSKQSTYSQGIKLRLGHKA